MALTSGPAKAVAQDTATVNGKQFTKQPNGTWLDSQGNQPNVADAQQLARAHMTGNAPQAGGKPTPEQQAVANNSPAAQAGQGIGTAIAGVGLGAVIAAGADKNKHGGDTGFTNAQQANADLAREAAGRVQAEAQKHNQIANRNEYAEASKQSIAKEQINQVNRMQNQAGSTGAAGLFDYQPEATDVTQIQARQDEQRVQGEQRNEVADEMEGSANTMQGVATDAREQNKTDAAHNAKVAQLAGEQIVADQEQTTPEPGSPAAEAGVAPSVETPPAGDTGAPSADAPPEAPVEEVQQEAPAADPSGEAQEEKAEQEEAVPTEHANARPVKLAGITDEDWQAIGIDPNKDVWLSKEDIESKVNPYLKSKGMTTVGADPGGRVFQGKGEKLELNQQGSVEKPPSDIHVKRIKRLVSDRKMKNIMSIVDRRF